MSRILVTGSCGFIGSHLVDALVEKGHHVVGLDDLSAGTLLNANHNSEIHIGSILDRDLLDQLFKHNKFDYVFHLAAQVNLRKSLTDPAQDAETNILGSLSVIENCVKYKVKKFVFFSSGGATYDATQPLPWSEETSLKPKSGYGLSKMTVEKYLEIAKETNGLNYCVLKPANIIGSRQSLTSQYSGVLSIFIRRALKNEDLIIYGNGGQSRDLISSEAVVRAACLMVEKNVEGVFNVSSNTQTTVNELAEMVLWMLPESRSNVIYKEAIIGEIEHTKLSSDKLKQLGWESELNLVKEAEKIIEWQKSVI